MLKNLITKPTTPAPVQAATYSPDIDQLQASYIETTERIKDAKIHGDRFKYLEKKLVLITAQLIEKGGRIPTMEGI